MYQQGDYKSNQVYSTNQRYSPTNQPYTNPQPYQSLYPYPNQPSIQPYRPTAYTTVAPTTFTTVRPTVYPLTSRQPALYNAGIQTKSKGKPDGFAAAAVQPYIERTPALSQEHEFECLLQNV